MKTKSPQKKSNLKRLTSKIGAVALLAVMSLIFSPAVYADMAADTVILNVVKVSYEDASGNSSFEASAFATVTISLIEAGVTISGRPLDSDGSRGRENPVPGEQGNLESGNTASYLFAITSNANGDIIYDIDVMRDSIDNVLDAGAAAASVTQDIVGPDGSTPLGLDLSSVTLGASAIIDQTGTTLSFPAGTLTGIEAGDIVVIGDTDYLVGSVDNGSAASYDLATGTKIPETPATMELAVNTQGGNSDPAGVTFAVGTPVYEQVLLLVEVTGVVEDPVDDGTVDFDIQVTTLAPAVNSNLIELQDVTTTYNGVELTIEKLVANSGDNVFGATAQGISGDTLIYQVTITNNGGEATNVVVADAVPDYTTLIDNAYSGNFASFTFVDGVNDASGTNTMADDAEDTIPVSGTASGTAAGSTLTFRVGPGHDVDALNPGGTLITNGSVVIRYQVTID